MQSLSFNLLWVESKSPSFNILPENMRQALLGSIWYRSETSSRSPFTSASGEIWNDSRSLLVFTTMVIIPVSPDSAFPVVDAPASSDIVHTAWQVFVNKKQGKKIWQWQCKRWNLEASRRKTRRFSETTTIAHWAELRNSKTWSALEELMEKRSQLWRKATGRVEVKKVKVRLTFGCQISMTVTVTLRFCIQLSLGFSAKGICAYYAPVFPHFPVLDVFRSQIIQKISYVMYSTTNTGLQPCTAEIIEITSFFLALSYIQRNKNVRKIDINPIIVPIRYFIFLFSLNFKA